MLVAWLMGAGVPSTGRESARVWGEDTGGWGSPGRHGSRSS